MNLNKFKSILEAQSAIDRGNKEGIEDLRKQIYLSEPQMGSSLALMYLSIAEDLSTIQVDRLSPEALHTLFRIGQTRKRTFWISKAWAVLDENTYWQLRVQAASYLVSIKQDKVRLNTAVLGLRAEFEQGIQLICERQMPSPSYTSMRSARKELQALESKLSKKH